MKKLVLMFVAIAAISFASCGNKAQAVEEEITEDSIEAVEDSTACDSIACDSIEATAEATETGEE